MKTVEYLTKEIDALYKRAEHLHDIADKLEKEKQEVCTHPDIEIRRSYDDGMGMERVRPQWYETKICTVCDKRLAARYEQISEMGKWQDAS